MSRSFSCLGAYTLEYLDPPLRVYALFMVVNESLLKLRKVPLMSLEVKASCACVHSKRAEDVQRGIAMLEASLPRSNSPLKVREEIYLLAVRFYRSGDYSRSRQLVERALEIAPDWRQASTLKKAIEDKITKDGVIGIGIAATAVGLLAGGIAATLSSRKK